MSKKNIIVVVSRYNEDLHWINEYPFNQFKYIVYNKGDNDNFYKSNVEKIINLRNVGMCDHTYLYHIIKNYNNLTDITVFLPGSVYQGNKKNKAINLLNCIINSNFQNAYFIGVYCNSVLQKFYNFTIDNHSSINKENNLKNGNTRLLKCQIRPYGSWYKYFLQNTKSNWYCYNGIFSFDKRDIIQHNIKRYISLIQTVNFHSNHEAAHYIERSWGSICSPLKATITIKE
jgi:hypothetical protein